MRSADETPDAATVLQEIRQMLDTRRQELLAQWESLERGSYESAENLARTSEVTDIKWALVDAFYGLYGLSGPPTGGTTPPT